MESYLSLIFMGVAGNSQLPETGKRTVSFIVIKNEQTSMTTQNRRKNSDIPLTEATPEQAISKRGLITRLMMQKLLKSYIQI